MSLGDELAMYSGWRSLLTGCVDDFRGWLCGSGLADPQDELRLSRLLEGLREDKLLVAFVAEYSRGKSELINAIFLAGHGGRLLPSAPGRTTMCPTELHHDASRPPQLSLLPIQTRATHAGVGDCKPCPELWQAVPLAVDSAPALQDALRRVSETLRVPPAEAERLGFEAGAEEGSLVRPGWDGLVEIPRWRHALINFPHPLLSQGLVILDTPGLNAIGTEPELTLSLLPSAHAVLFLLAADTGVTQSDLAVWNAHVGPGGADGRSRLVVLNKIDGLWDELKSPEAVDADIEGQAAACAVTLGLPRSQIFPVSAQKGLVARVTGNSPLLARSRLPQLEAALSGQLIPAKWSILRERAEAEFGEVRERVGALLESRLAGLREQLAELSELRGKNRSMIVHLMGKARAGKEQFEASLQQYQAVRSVFSGLSDDLFDHLGLDALHERAHSTRGAMLGATFSKSLSDSMADFFRASREALARSEKVVAEILTMMEGVYRKFVAEHGLKLGSPAGFSLTRCERDIDRLEQWCDTHLNTPIHLLTQEKATITRRFFEQVAVQARRAFGRANKDAEVWLKAVMAPLEAQVRERQAQLRRRLDDIQRIHAATGTLEEKIIELKKQETDLLAQVRALEGFHGRMRQLLARSPAGAPA